LRPRFHRSSSGDTERPEEPRKPGETDSLTELALVLEEPLVLERAVHVVVASDEPPRLSIGELRGVHGLFAAKLRVEGVGLRLELGAGDVEGGHW
jgi:hypothetical protein